ncbi:MAG TPA: suppressor of fused domain protein [Planktothrix sp.]|jgi:hypothetical protein
MAKKQNDEPLDDDIESIGAPPEDDPVAQRQLLIDAWTARDELYKQLFGDLAYTSPKNYGTPSPIVKAKGKDLSTAHGGSGDPGNPEADEQHLAVLAYPPDPLRHYWTYVTAGLCSPWLQQQPGEVSGFGCELAIKSPTDALWPARILRSLAFYIFNHAGTISSGVRIALNAPINEPGQSALRNVLVWYLDEAPDAIYQLPSGAFGLFCVMGITDEELKFAESVDEYGTWCVHEALRSTGNGQVTNPDRASLITDANAELLNNYRIFANNFGADLATRQQQAQDDD